MRNQHTTVLLSPSGKESSKQNPRHPLTSMEQKLSGISEEVPQHGAMKAVLFSDSPHSPLDIPSGTHSRA